MLVNELIRFRRSIDPDDFNAKLVANAIVHKMIEAAHWAPTHGYTEPWRFIIYDNKHVKDFGTLHANVYKENTPSQQFLAKKYDKILHRGDLASHIIIIVAEHGMRQNIPEIEEILAVGCAVQNMMLIATDHNVSTFWSTGGMCYHPALAEALHLSKSQQILGFLFLGLTDKPIPLGRRENSAESRIIKYYK
jgi:nitroreductase